MRKSVLIFRAVGLVGLAAGNYSCSQERETISSNEVAVIHSIEKARDFLVSEAGGLLLPDTYYKANGDEPGTRSPEMQSMLSGAIQPDWSRAQVWEWEKDIVTEIPTTLTSPISYTTLIRERGDTVSLTTQPPHTRVRIIENLETGNMFGFVITLLPNDLYTGNLSELAPNPEGSDFSGITVYSSLDGTPIWGWRYDVGEIVNILLFDTEYDDCVDPDVRIFMGFNVDAATRTSFGYILEGVTCRPSHKYDDNFYDDLIFGQDHLMDWNDIGGGGGRIPPRNPTPPPSPKPDATTSAPLASKLFRNSTMSDANWEKIEDMVKKIMNDCMGGKLYNALDSAMGSGTLAIRFVSSSVGSSFSSDGIKLADFESGSLFHEMFHAYQSYQESTATFEASKANREVEAYLAEYMYLKKLPEFTPSSKWAQRYGKGFKKDVAKLSEYLSKNGTLISSGTSTVFNNIYVGTGLQISDVYSSLTGRSIPFDYGRSVSQNLKNISYLSKDC